MTIPPLALDHLSPGARRLLEARGVSTDEALRRYLSPRLEDLHATWDFPQMERVAHRLLTARGQGEMVGIHGDADPDGISGTAVLDRLLRRAGIRTRPYVPDRLTDGHGISRRGFELLRREGCKVIVSVDTGTTSYDIADAAVRWGIDLIVTDHHQVPEKPLAAFALLNPHVDYPWPPCLAGVGVALKVALALAERTGIELEDDYYALTAIGTIADQVPLVDDNRPIVRAGLEGLRRPTWPGLSLLAARLEGRDPTEVAVKSELVPVMACPRSDGGRNPAFDLAVAETEADAERFLEQATRIQLERERALESALERTRESLAAQGLPAPGRLALVADVPECDPLALGFVAGRLHREYGLPVIVISRRGDVAAAEARGPRGIDFPEAFGAVEDRLIQYGGHRPAAGFTARVDDVPQLIDALTRILEAQADRWTALVPTAARPEARFDFSELTTDDWAVFEAMRPFGKGNPPPVLEHSGPTRGLFRSDGGGEWIHAATGRKIEGGSDCTTLLDATGPDTHLIWSPRPGEDGRLVIHLCEDSASADL